MMAMSVLFYLARGFSSLALSILILHFEALTVAVWNNTHDLVVSPWIGYPILFGVGWFSLHLIMWREVEETE